MSKSESLNLNQKKRKAVSKEINGIRLNKQQQMYALYIKLLVYSFKVTGLKQKNESKQENRSKQGTI